MAVYIYQSGLEMCQPTVAEHKKQAIKTCFGTPEWIRTISVAHSAPQGALPPHGARLRSLSSPGAVIRRLLPAAHGEDALPQTLSVDGSNLFKK